MYKAARHCKLVFVVESPKLNQILTKLLPGLELDPTAQPLVVHLQFVVLLLLILVCIAGTSSIQYLETNDPARFQSFDAWGNV